MLHDNEGHEVNLLFPQKIDQMIFDVNGKYSEKLNLGKQPLPEQKMGAVCAT